VEKAINEQPSTFTVFDIQKVLKTKGYTFKVPSIRTAFRRIESLKKVVVISQGKGRRASVYSKATNV